MDTDASSFLALIEAVLSLAAPQVPRPREGIIKPGGYPEDIFLSLPEDEKDDLECAICYQILKEAMQCNNKHKFCHSCIYVWSTSGRHLNRTRCPVCRIEGRYERNKDLDERIENKRVRCSLKSCKWTGMLKYHSVHQHTNYSVSSQVTLETKELPLLSGRSTPANRSTSSNSQRITTRTGLPVPTNHTRLRARLSGNRFRSDDNNNNSSSHNNNSRISSSSITSNSGVSSSVDTSVGADRRSPAPSTTPRPPTNPRPAGLVTRHRMTSLPALRRPARSRVNLTNTSDAATSGSSEVRPAESTAPELLRERVDQVDNNLTNIRSRLQESHSHLDALMDTFGSELEQHQQEVISIHVERERQRQEQLDEVRELGRRLGQVASELRRLLSQRRTIRDELNDLLD
ncbi:uncharacterized protein LOC121367435 [Gigantopelta aegis]|uniref:uncharacterized protein LOC121367435 n=1 Tax=Gigantopelta aegis TaxID=1735272 RepID=UPI001B88DEC4|nr:uncharacterized protein LOC121367435 [Gigantopelta aegis]